MQKEIMRFTGLLLLIFSSFVFASDYPSCNITETKEISYRTNTSKDVLEISVVGDPCYDAKYSITIRTENGDILYQYKSKIKQHNSVQWADKSFDKVAEKHVKYVLKNAITTSSTLPSKFECEFEEPNCDAYEHNTVPINEYNEIRKRNIPMLNHSTYYEGWASFVYSSETRKTIKVLEGGL